MPLVPTRPLIPEPGFTKAPSSPKTITSGFILNLAVFTDFFLELTDEAIPPSLEPIESNSLTS